LPVDADVFLGNYSLDPVRLDCGKYEDCDHGRIAEAQDRAAADAHRDPIVFLNQYYPSGHGHCFSEPTMGMSQSRFILEGVVGLGHTVVSVCDVGQDCILLAGFQPASSC
jgi:hypothetical protein